MRRVKIHRVKDKFCYAPDRFMIFRDQEWEGTALDVLRATEPGVLKRAVMAKRSVI